MNSSFSASAVDLDDLMNGAFDSGVGVILDTGAFDALHAHLREVLAPLAKALVMAHEADAPPAAGEMERAVRGLATQVALALWNTTPLPENHFRPPKALRPERNAPCPCGSGRKYKQCCGEVDSPEQLSLPREDMLARVLRHLPRERLLQAAAGLGLEVLTELAVALRNDDRCTEVVALLEPWFANPKKFVDGAALALTALCSCYYALDRAGALAALTQRVEHSHNRRLREVLYQQEVAHFARSHQLPAARQALRTAQAFAPGNPSLACLEVLLLGYEGRFEAAERRAVEIGFDHAGHPNFAGVQAMLDQVLGEIGQLREGPDQDDAFDDALAALPQDYPRRRLQLHIVLERIEPPIWRRIEVENDLSFAELHRLIQVAMGWDDDHLYAFTVGEQCIGPVEYDNPFDDTLPDDQVTLGQMIGRRRSLRYTYDFGDDWHHRITIEKRLPSRPDAPRARLIAGERACPPEDCGGVWGYARLLDALRNPDAEEDREFLEWLGDFEPEAFELERTRRAVGQVVSAS